MTDAELAAALTDMREALTAHLAHVVRAVELRLFGPGPRMERRTDRGRCGWCARPFLHLIQYRHGALPPPAARYCSTGHEQAGEQARRAIARRRRRGDCPHPDKRVWVNAPVAAADTASYPVPVRTYQCICTGWHVTKAKEFR